jgi:hypothetical protein
MIYRPAEKKLWDSWVYLHEGTYYLYYLVAGEGSWEGVGLATSTDGVHWSEVGTVVDKKPDANWLGTGSVWKAEDFAMTGRFICNYSEWRNGRPEEPSPSDGRQTIFFAESTDLVHWTRIEGVEFAQDERWYEPKGRWDCIYTIPRPGGGRYGYWTATPKGGPGAGFGETMDGVTWTALEPPEIEWGHAGPMEGCEVGGVEEIDGRYYMMLGGCGYDLHVNGMWTFVADKPEGPFKAARHNRALLASRARANSYFARFFPTAGGMLVNHHSIPREGNVAFAPMKRAVVDKGGTLRLGWWEGNEALKGEEVEVSAPFDMERGLVIEGAMAGVGLLGSGGAGVYVWDGQKGTAIYLRPPRTVEFGPMERDGVWDTPDDWIDREVKCGETPTFRLLVRWSMAELYVNDVFIHCYSLPAAKVAVVEMLESVTAMVTWRKAWRMSFG